MYLLKTITNFTGLMILQLLVFAQAPFIKQWDKGYGGDVADDFSLLKKTFDGGYLVAGVTNSDSTGDISQPKISQYLDFWILKIDSHGNRKWDKRYGGLHQEFLSDFIQTADKGYILIGTSFSGASGDKSEPSRGKEDVWVVKADSLGNKQWDKTFGGASDDYGSVIHQTSDKGYLIGGSITSDAGGEITDASRGSWDYWLIKVDSLGNKLWDKRYGGSDRDGLSTIQPISDNEFILAGTSRSPVSGDKTQPDWGPVFEGDFWLIKIDSLGNKLWDKRYGGTHRDGLSSIKMTNDNGFILYGSSESEIGGDKSTQNKNSLSPSTDYWIIKIDSAGVKQWDRTYGGTSYDDAIGNIISTFDNGYLLSGSSASDVSGDKTEHNLGFPGSRQIWLVKIDSNGIKQWDKTIFNRHGPEAYLSQAEDSCYLLGSTALTRIGGYRTDTNSLGETWVMKFCETKGLVPFEVFIMGDDAFCYGGNEGQIIATAAGGMFPYHFQWNNGSNSNYISYASAGLYSVTVTDGGGNIVTDSIEIFQPPQLSIALVSHTDVSCSTDSSGTAVIKTSGGSGNHYYYWSTGSFKDSIFGLPAGPYSVTISDSYNCSTDTTIIIRSQFLNNVGSIIGPDTVIVNTATYFSADSGFNYTWDANNGNIISGQGTPNIAAMWNSTGQDLVLLVASDSSCIDTISKSILIIDPTSINNSHRYFIELFPNPTSGTSFVRVVDTNSKTVIRIYDDLGKLINEKVVDSKSLKSGEFLDFTPYSGCIFLVTITSNQFNKAFKVIKTGN